MPAVCYYCADKSILTSIPKPVGIMGNPLADCQICHVFVCGYHGALDASVPAFYCTPCVSVQVQQSAQRILESQIEERAPATVEAARPPPALPEAVEVTQTAPEFNSLDDFFQKMPSFDSIDFRQGVIRAEINPVAIEGEEFRRRVTDATGDAKDLFVLAGTLSGTISPHSRRLTPELRWLRKSVGEPSLQ